MLISVIIPTFNRSHTLKRAIDSVLNQTYQNFELIVVDDASSDETSKILSHYDNIKVINNEKNLGVSAARNKGAREAKGDYFAFLDSDDEWLEHKLETQVKALKEKPFKIIHGEEIWIRNGKRVNPKKIHQKSGGDIFKKCLALCLISPSAVMIERETFFKHHGFDEEYIVCEDYDFWLRLTSLYEVGFIEEPIINKYGGHEDQLSQKYKAMDYFRVKSMDRIFSASHMSEDYKKATSEMIVKKAEILVQGYLKHNNLDNLPEIQAILQKYK